MVDLLSATQRIVGASRSTSSDYDLDTPNQIGRTQNLRPAAVLAAITTGATGQELILTKRSSALRHHPGQIAFPGGKQDPGDPDLEDTALREANEEIGLPPGHVELIGRLPAHETVTGFLVTPIVARVTHPTEFLAEIGEVDEVFTVPLDFVLSPTNFVIERRRWRGGVRSYYTVPYGPYYIWGATARILKTWADQI